MTERNEGDGDTGNKDEGRRKKRKENKETSEKQREGGGGVEEGNHNQNFNITLCTFSRARHIAAGMRHLEKEGILHRDLALRNLLVGVYQETEKYCIKVSGKATSDTLGERGERERGG